MNFFQKILCGFAVLEETDSPINGKIQVREDLWGKRSLVVGGLTQSGVRVEQLWQPAMRSVLKRNLRVENCLILGLGAGSFVKLTSKQYPKAKILGIEIDPEVVRLGRKYFNFGAFENLEIRIGDALHLDQLGPPVDKGRRFDLILVDLYVGDKIPMGMEDGEFLGLIRERLTVGGLVIFNRLYYAEKKEKTDKFGKELKKFFRKVEAKKVGTNKLFLCQNEGTN